MAYPSFGSYLSAVQNPAIVFQDQDLRGAAVEKTPLGLPRAISGGFAVTFRMSRGPTSWAVRCFTTERPDLQSRYAALTATLPQLGMTELIPFQYIQDGILVDGSRYPIVKMQWVTGQTLGTYVEKHVTASAKLQSVLSQFTALVSALERHGIAHGDLQHGNVVVDGNQLRLIDYDGMFVPSLANRKASELGHVNYQSPLREATHYGPYLDRFSAIVIAIALQALSLNPQLWKKYAQGENLLFNRADFVDPDGSALLQELSQIAELKYLVPQFKVLCRAPLETLPILEDFLTGTASISQRAGVTLPALSRVRMRQYQVVEATDTDGVLAHVGQILEVVGQVKNVFRTTTYHHRPCAFVNFGERHMGAFYLVLWEESLAQMRSKGQDLESYVGEWVAVTGLVQTYRQRPQIIIDEPNQLRLLHSEKMALELLAQGKHDQRLVTYSTRQNNMQIPPNSNVRQRLGQMASPSAAVVEPHAPKSSNAKSSRSNKQSQSLAGYPSTPNREPSANRRVRQNLQQLDSETRGSISTQRTTHPTSKVITSRQSGANASGGNIQPTLPQRNVHGQNFGQHVRTSIWWIVGILFVLWIIF